MNPELLNVEQLKQWLGYARPSDVEKWLKSNEIPYWHGAGGHPITTLTALNTTLIGKNPLQSADDTTVIDFRYGQKTQKSSG